MVLIVGNSLVKEWRSADIRTCCLPGAALPRLVDVAEEEAIPSDKFIFIQSGIPDLHNKGELDIDSDKIKLYKEELKKVHTRLSEKCVLLPIYPPLNTAQEVMSTYFGINRFIFDLNYIKMSNIMSRIFHKCPKTGLYRVEARRLKEDGIHLTTEESRKVFYRIKTFISTYQVPTQDKKRLQPETITEKETLLPPEKRLRIRVSVKGDTQHTKDDRGTGTITDRIKEIIEKKDNKIAKLRRALKLEEERLERECMKEVKTIMEGDKEEQGDYENERFVVLDEVFEEEEKEPVMMRSRDIRENVPKTIYLPQGKVKHIN